MPTIDVEAPLIFNAGEIPTNPTPQELRDTVDALWSMAAHIACFDHVAGQQLIRAACTLALITFFVAPRPRLRLIQGGLARDIAPPWPGKESAEPGQGGGR